MVFPFTNQNGPKLTNLCEACQGVVAKMSIWPKLELRVVRNNLFFLSGSNQVLNLSSWIFPKTDQASLYLVLPINFFPL